MRIPENMADLIFSKEAYQTCQLLTGFDFVRFCRERHVDVSEERLSKLERLRVFVPVLRIYRSDVVRKIELVDEGRAYRDLGLLQDDEQWSGDTRTELAAFDVRRDLYEGWREHGYAWDPRNASVLQLSRPNESRRHVAYYSQFQIRPLARLLNWLTQRIEMERVVEDDGATANLPEVIRQERMAAEVRSIVGYVHAHPDHGAESMLCQMIANRYYPHTQSDERHFTLSTDGIWDWHSFARDWNPSSVVEAFQVSPDELERMYESLASEQAHIDPIAAWYALGRFVAIDKRKRLKGDALRAMSIREMALMLRLFHKDAFGTMLPEPHEVHGTIIHRIPDISPDDDPLRALELVSNAFHVNPKPQLVLFVEGETENVVVPVLLKKLFGLSMSVLGIELVNLHGIGNVAGGKEHPYSALWRLVDYLHHHQTIAVILADNEGFATRNLRHGLPSATSTYLSDRHVTRPEYVRVWRKSFEFDNFSNTEIARAMSLVGGTHFSRREIGPCRAEAGNSKKGHATQTLEALFLTRSRQPLNKPAIGYHLVEMMCDPKCKRDASKRPIARFLAKVVELAARNHQPDTHEMWEFNQRTGYLGTLKPGAAAKRKPPFGRKRRKKT